MAGDGKLDSVNFRGGTLTDVRFENCLLRDPDFSHATLLRVGFGGCNLTGADFTKATCTDVDLRGASLGIAAGFDALRGTTIDSVQLVTLAPQLADHWASRWRIDGWPGGQVMARTAWAKASLRSR